MNLDRHTNLENVEGTLFVLAPVWRRLTAGLLDWILALVCGVIGGVLAEIGYIYFGDLWFVGYLGGGAILSAAITGFCLVVLMTHLAFGLQVVNKGWTPGHKLMRLRIESLDGIRIGLSRSWIRQLCGSPFLLFYLLPILFLYSTPAFLAQLGGSSSVYRLEDLIFAATDTWFYWGLVVAPILSLSNHVLVFIDRIGRGWHDWLAGTVVVRDERLTSRRSR